MKILFNKSYRNCLDSDKARVNFFDKFVELYRIDLNKDKYIFIYDSFDKELMPFKALFTTQSNRLVYLRGEVYAYTECPINKIETKVFSKERITNIEIKANRDGYCSDIAFDIQIGDFHIKHEQQQMSTEIFDGVVKFLNELV